MFGFGFLGSVSDAFLGTNVCGVGPLAPCYHPNGVFGYDPFGSSSPSVDGSSFDSSCDSSFSDAGFAFDSSCTLDGSHNLVGMDCGTGFDSSTAGFGLDSSSGCDIGLTTSGFESSVVGGIDDMSTGYAPIVDTAAQVNYDAATMGYESWIDTSGTWSDPCASFDSNSMSSTDWCGCDSGSGFD